MRRIEPLVQTQQSIIDSLAKSVEADNLRNELSRVGQ
jgi:hypothetical protein